MNADDITGGLLRALLPLSALIVLERSPLHGYALMGELKPFGFRDIKSGTLYPLLKRLQENGLIEAKWHLSDSGPAKKLFRTTQLGRDAIRDVAASHLGTLGKLHVLESEGQ